VALFNPLYISQTHLPTQLVASPSAVRFEPFASPDLLLLLLLLLCDYLLPLPSPLVPAWETRLSTSASLAKFLFGLPTLRHRLFPPGLGYARESHPYLPVPSHPIPSHPIPSHPIPSHPIPLLPSFSSRLILFAFQHHQHYLRHPSDRVYLTYLPRLVPCQQAHSAPPSPSSTLGLVASHRESVNVVASSS
jgi:hypothetical protein